MAKPTKAEQLKAALERAKIRNELVKRAFAILNEMAVPVAVLIPGENSIIVTGEWDSKFVVIVYGPQKVYTNAEARHALAMIEDFAEFSITSRTKVLEARIEKAIEHGEWGGSEDDGDTKA